MEKPDPEKSASIATLSSSVISSVNSDFTFQMLGTEYNSGTASRRAQVQDWASSANSHRCARVTKAMMERKAAEDCGLATNVL